jgi:hypothetical protein
MSCAIVFVLKEALKITLKLNLGFIQNRAYNSENSYTEWRKK